MPWPMASLASSGISVFEFGLGAFMLKKRRPGGAEQAANSAQALDVLMSTILTASIRARGGSA